MPSNRQPVRVRAAACACQGRFITETYCDYAAYVVSVSTEIERLDHDQRHVDVLPTAHRCTRGGGCPRLQHVSAQTQAEAPRALVISDFEALCLVRELASHPRAPSSIREAPELHGRPSQYSRTASVDTSLKTCPVVTSVSSDGMCRDLSSRARERANRTWLSSTVWNPSTLLKRRSPARQYRKSEWAGRQTAATASDPAPGARQCCTSLPTRLGLNPVEANE